MVEPKKTEGHNGLESDKNGDDSCESKLKYPKAVFLIVVTEFCERWSYYGMRAVLTIYMTTVLGFTDNSATTVYHTFLLLCYALPLFWGIIADSWLGKYRTIVYVSTIFALGNIVLTLSSMTPLNLPAAPLTMLGLILMAIGTGGMKPCVAPLGGDQFVVPQQDKQLQQFFSVFLFSVSVGNMFSTLVTPILRTGVHCFGETTCYPIAFGIPACLMVFAITIFTCGKRFYKMNKPEGNMAMNVFRCVSYAVSQKSNKKKEAVVQSHWLDYASDKFDENLINDIKGLLRVLVYYLPVPWFFALYEQLGSRWTLQATRMTGIIGNYTILPDQMQVCNAILMFIFIPIFETLVYPLFHRCNLLKKPLQKMVVGGFLAALSFCVAGIVELQIQNSSAVIPNAGEANINFINTLPCAIELSGKRARTNSSIQPEEDFMLAVNERNFSVAVTVNQTSCNNLKFKPGGLAWNGKISTNFGTVQTAIIAISNGTVVLQMLEEPVDTKKSKEGKAKLKIIFSKGFQNGNNRLIEIELVDNANEITTFFINTENNTGLYTTTTHQIKPNKYDIRIVSKNGNSSENETATPSENIGEVDLGTGGSYIIMLHQDYLSLLKTKSHLSILTKANEVHILWLLPQYALMAAGEVMLIISGMEFSFTQAPKSMKSVLQSCWHLTNACGNIIVIISAQIKATQVTQFFVFAAVVAADMIVFAFMAAKYTYVSFDGKKVSCSTPKSEVQVK